MKVIGYVCAGGLVLFGIIFCVAAAASGIAGRWILGAILLGAGFAVMFLIRMKVPATHVTVTQKVDLSGDVELERLSCKSCGASLDSESPIHARKRFNSPSTTRLLRASAGSTQGDPSTA